MVDSIPEVETKLAETRAALATWLRKEIQESICPLIKNRGVAFDDAMGSASIDIGLRNGMTLHIYSDGGVQLSGKELHTWGKLTRGTLYAECRFQGTATLLVSKCKALLQVYDDYRCKFIWGDSFTIQDFA